ncbi:MAG TPA: penicillin-binding protein 2 [Acidimicrobiales bacterium]|nr:penicillin-binding protein 2 [Acidimicrobiales bacterium]
MPSGKQMGSVRPGGALVVPRARAAAHPDRRSHRSAPDPRRSGVHPRSFRKGKTSWADVCFQRRVRVIRLLLVAALLLLVARLVDIQVVRAGGYEAAARGESSIVVTLPSLRGGIYARDGSPLALSVATQDVVADDFQVAHPVQTALALSPLLNVPATNLATELHQHSGYVVLARQLSQVKAQKITADAFPGITTVEDSKRLVTNGNLAAPVLGFTNASGAGAAGLEYGDNQLLSGRAGKETIIESPSGVSLPQSPVTDRVASTAGVGVELTIDNQLQYESEQALAGAIESSHAVSGTAVVMDVKTGQILSMANLVSTHPDGPLSTSGSTAAGTPPARGAVLIGPKDAVNEAPNNLAVSQLYEPGSVFKLVTFSGALQDGLINPNTVFSVPDQIHLDGSTFHDAEPHPTESLTATQILAQSSNIGTSEIAQGLGERRLLAQVGNLGFGRMTTLHFPGESPGLLASAAQWEPTDYVSLPIGQVDAVNALQILDAYNAVANGGQFVEPTLVQATLSPSGAVTRTPPSPTHQAFAPQIDAELTSMLQQVVTTGTGGEASVPGYTVAGKTGTAQIPTQGKDSYVIGAYMASFVGFAPAVNPTLSMIVVLDRPTPIFGGTVAAPVFSQIMSYALHRYDIPTTPGATIKTAPTVTRALSSQAQDIT